MLDQINSITSITDLGALDKNKECFFLGTRAVARKQN